MAMLDRIITTEAVERERAAMLLDSQKESWLELGQEFGREAKSALLDLNGKRGSFHFDDDGAAEIYLHRGFLKVVPGVLTVEEDPRLEPTIVARANEKVLLREPTFGLATNDAAGVWLSMAEKGDSGLVSGIQHELVTGWQYSVRHITELPESVLPMLIRIEIDGNQ